MAAPTPQDWRQLAKFCDDHYVRHLVDENGDFEMMVSWVERGWKEGVLS